MQSSNYNSLTLQFIAKVFQFDWLPLPLIKCLPLPLSLHDLEVAAHILVLGATDNLEYRIILNNSKQNQILLKNEDFAIKGNLIILERTLQHLWQVWKYVMFAPNPRVGKRRMVSAISSVTEYEAIRRLLMKVYGIGSGVLLRTIIK